MLSYQVSDKYVISAIDNGRVINSNKTTVEIQYSNNLTKKYIKRSWTSKEESNACYTHNLVSDLNKGDLVEVGDTILYDELFFEADIFDKKKVIFRPGTVINTALMEDMQTFEDSCAISEKAATLLSTRVTKVKSMVVSAQDEVVNIVKIGDKLEAGYPLLSITDPHIAKYKGLDEEALEALKRLKQSTPTSSYKGIVSKIVIYYNADFNNLSDTLKELVTISDKNIAAQSSKNYTGRVSSAYSIQGKPLLEDQVEIKIYIDTNESMGIGDKGIFGNQLKTTLGEVYSYDINTIDKTPVDAIFGFMSISARIVNSPIDIGTTNKTLELVTEQALKLYFEE